MTKFEIIDHEHDVVVVGAGGAGLRATVGMWVRDRVFQRNYFHKPT